MSKVILILNEEPNYCKDCNFIVDTIERKNYCCALQKSVEPGQYNMWCPLRELPKKLTNASDKLNEMKKGNIVPSSVGFDWSDIIYENGWNNCIDQILGTED